MHAVTTASPVGAATQIDRRSQGVAATSFSSSAAVPPASTQSVTSPFSGTGRFTVLHALAWGLRLCATKSAYLRPATSLSGRMMTALPLNSGDHFSSQVLLAWLVVATRPHR